MEADQLSRSKPDRASAPARKQRAGTKFTGGFGMKTGESDLLFVEGQLPEDEDGLASDESPTRQLELCLRNLDAALERHGKDSTDVLQVTMYLADMDAYDAVNDTYQAYFDEPYPARTTLGVCELLGGAGVTIDAVVALE